ncbi:hypothetical protein LTR86_002740 [Recurvomyces mirabilis]|nr:hypothetical protein LTR86_002740 [Recurvomyces mirabilis]
MPISTRSPSTPDMAFSDTASTTSSRNSHLEETHKSKPDNMAGFTPLAGYNAASPQEASPIRTSDDGLDRERGRAHSNRIAAAELVLRLQGLSRKERAIELHKVRRDQHAGLGNVFTAYMYDHFDDWDLLEKHAPGCVKFGQQKADERFKKVKGKSRYPSKDFVAPQQRAAIARHADPDHPEVACKHAKWLTDFTGVTKGQLIPWKERWSAVAAINKTPSPSSPTSEKKSGWRNSSKVDSKISTQAPSRTNTDIENEDPFKPQFPSACEPAFHECRDWTQWSLKDKPPVPIAADVGPRGELEPCVNVPERKPSKRRLRSSLSWPSIRKYKKDKGEKSEASSVASKLRGFLKRIRKAVGSAAAEGGSDCGSAVVTTT